MGRILIKYEKHDKTFWQKYWGLILFPLLPIWLLSADDGNAGWLDVDGHSYKLKYSKRHHPQVIQVSNGTHHLCYRKKSKIAIAFMDYARQTSSGSFGLDLATAALDRLNGYDDYHLDSCSLTFDSNTTLTLSAVGGVTKECTVVDLSGVPQEPVTPSSHQDNPTDTPSSGSSGCLKAIIAVLFGLLLVLLTLCFIFVFVGTVKPAESEFTSHTYNTGFTTKKNDLSIDTTTLLNPSTTTTTTSRGDKMYVGARQSLPLHKLPDSGSDILLNISRGSEVAVIKRYDGWFQVYIGGQYGWCDASCLFDTYDAAITATTTTPATPVGPTKYVVAIGGLRLREQPHLEGKVLTTIPNKTAVVVEEMAGDWAKITYDGKTGWCSATYLFDSVEEGTATTTQASTENGLSIVSAGVDEANRRIESYRGQAVSGAKTKESLTDDEVLSLFHSAYDHFMQYVGGNITGRFETIPGATYENAPIYDSMDGVWRPGIHPDYPDFDALVSSYFAVLSDDLAAYYLKDKISLIDGRMYYTWYHGKGDEGVKYDLSYAVNTTATGYEVVVTANYYRDYNNPDMITSTETITFPCEKEDGAWVFTAMHWIPT